MVHNCDAGARARRAGRAASGGDGAARHRIGQYLIRNEE
jgi:hypothetical protein